MLKISFKFLDLKSYLTVAFKISRDCKIPNLWGLRKFEIPGLRLCHCLFKKEFGKFFISTETHSSWVRKAKFLRKVIFEVWIRQNGNINRGKFLDKYFYKVFKHKDHSESDFSPEEKIFTELIKFRLNILKSYAYKTEIIFFEKSELKNSL